MSDGGAGAMVKCGELLSHSRVGRVVLALVTMFGLFNAAATGFKGSRGDGWLLLVSAVSAFFFAFGTIRTWFSDRAERANKRSMRHFMMLFGAIMLFGIMMVAGIIVLIRWRRRGDEEQLEKLDPAEIDRMALEEADGAI